MNEQRRRRVLTGLTLIVLGLALYLLEYVGNVNQSATFFLIGGTFLAAYFYQRRFGFLIPGCLLLGLGGSGFLELSSKVGLGVGFVAITAIALAYQRRFHWWPLIPGGVLILVGLERLELIRRLFENWPLILVLVGVLILFGALGRREATAD